MSAASRGGRRAAQPNASWAPTERLLPGGTSVLFIEETGGRSKVFDFAVLPVSEPIQQWLAASFARQVTARSGIKRVGTARGLAGAARMFAAALAEHPVAVEAPQDITAEHFLAFRQRHEHLTSLSGYISCLRRLLKGDEELSASARDALVAVRVRKFAQEVRDPEYTDAEWQEITTAVRHDIRVARDRIRSGRDLLARFRAGSVEEGGDEDKLARLLDVFDRTGDVPRYRGGTCVNEVSEVGGVTRIASLLCLSLDELTAFGLLLTALTGQNFGTVVTWPAAHFRPDGGLTEDGLALVESVKPRRGPEREHMVVALEDVLTGGDLEPRLLRSPLRIYRLLLDLGETARRLGGLDTLFAGRAATPGPQGSTQWASAPGGHHVLRWARGHGFPSALSAASCGHPAVSVRRLRMTAIERRRRPVAHTARTMRDTYLMPSPTVQEESRQVVAAALEAEVDKARGHHTVPVLTSAFVDLAHQDPQAAAEAAGLEPGRLKELVNGTQDTALASCVDHAASPHDPPGQPCSASFLTCLDCVNARALPHQLPVQLAAAETIQAMRPHLDPQLWSVRFAPRLQQLQDIASAFEATEVARARDAITPDHQRLVTELLEGRWDLR